MNPILLFSRRMSFSFLILILLLGAAVTACAATTSPTQAVETGDDDVDAEVSPGDLPTRQPSECPALDSQLLQLIQAGDGLSMAEELGFPVQEEKVQVLILLTGEETDFLQRFDADVGTQSGNEVQAYVPLEQLCDLANDETVSAVRPVAQPMP